MKKLSLLLLVLLYLGSINKGKAINSVINPAKYPQLDLMLVTANTVSGDTIFCRNYGLVQLNGQPAGGIWSGPGVTGNTFNTAIGADVITAYSLRYEYTDSNSNKYHADLKLWVKPEPVIVIDPAGSKLCFGEPYTITAQYNHADGLFWWKGSQSDGTIKGDATSTSISYDPGLNDMTRLYFWVYVKTTHTDNVCAPAYDSIQISMSAMPVPEFSANPVGDCTPLTVQFSDMSTINPGTIDKWEWSFGDGDISGDQNPLHIYLLPARYDVTLKVISDAGCEKELLKPQYIESYIVPTANFIPNPQLASLSNPTIEFQNMSTNITPNTIYLWNFGDYVQYTPGGGSSTQKDPNFKYSDTGHYQVKLAVSNEFGCTDTMKREVVILPFMIIIENNHNPDFMLYPNPAHNIFNIENPLSEPAKMILSDILGKTLLEKKIIPGKSTIPIQSF